MLLLLILLLYLLLLLYQVEPLLLIVALGILRVGVAVVPCVLHEKLGLSVGIVLNLLQLLRQI